METLKNLIKPREQKLANAIYTNSLMEIMDALVPLLPEIQIFTLKAASIHSDKEVDFEDDNCGLTIKNGGDKNAIVNYQFDGAKSNTFDEFSVKTIKRELKKRDIQDLAVEELVLLWKNDEFANKCGIKDKEWILWFISDKPNGEPEIQSFNAIERNLENLEIGFKRMVLNLTEVGSQIYYFTKKAEYKQKGCPLHWWGDRLSPLSLNCPISLVQYIQEKIPMTKIKRMIETKEATLVVDGVI